MSVDDQAAQAVLEVFAKYKVPPGGVLRRHQFFEVRDADFQRGIDKAVKNGWIARHHRDRYRYILTEQGRQECRVVLLRHDVSLPTYSRPALPKQNSGGRVSAIEDYVETSYDREHD
jgi:hypothetical protein